MEYLCETCVSQKKRLVPWSHPADVLWALKELESLHSTLDVIFLSTESQKVSKRMFLFSRPMGFFILKLKINSKMIPVIFNEELIMEYKYCKLRNKRAIFKRFLIKSISSVPSITVCPCLLWFISLFLKTSVVLWRTYEVKPIICVVIHSKYVNAEWKSEMKGLINNIFYSYSNKKRLHLFIPWSSFSFQ